MKNLVTTLLLNLAFSSTMYAQLIVHELLVENKTNPVGIHVNNPRLSWQLRSAERNVMQSAYQVSVAESPGNLVKGKALTWTSGRINSDQSVHIRFEGAPLQSGKTYYWQVRVWDTKGRSATSKPASWQMGLLQPGDWKAKWIKAGYVEDSVLRPSPLLRKEFSISKRIKTATAYITSRGLYEAYINGKRVGDYYLTPGWTSYNKRLQYQVYDVTGLLSSGNNAIGVMLGSGWYRGNLAWGGNKNTYGKELGLLLQVNIEYSDGSTDNVLSDESWKSSTGRIVSSEIYHGETQDARLEKDNWDKAGYNDGNWSPVKLMDQQTASLVTTENEPIRKKEQFKPVKIFTTPKGEQVIDFGQNLVGWVLVKVTGNAGDRIVLQHAEVLDKAGNFYTTNLRAAKQENTYVLKGGQEEVFEPHFTFQGFRYVKVQGLSELKPEQFTAIALYSDMKPTGNFVSSHPLINQLQHNIQWGQKGNFLDVPTDCPQRDERLGWTGDAQVFSRTAAYNMQVNNFFSKWMKDVTADQLPNGSVPHVVPNVLGAGSTGSAGWADVVTIVPWNMYLVYGDKVLLEESYPGMKRWVEFMKENSTDNLWNKGFHFGDWLFYRPDDDNDGRSAITDKYLIAQAFYAHSTQNLINAARVLGKAEDERNYSALLNIIKDAFRREYLTSKGRMVSGSQTAYVLALQFDLLPDSLRPQAAARLVQNIKDYNNHLTTGFLGTPYLCHVLSRFGYTDIAYTLLLQETYPSWLYPVKMGATTIWERWDGQKPDGSFQTPGMNSFNHYAYGAIGDWMYRVVAGIELDESAPGYKKIVIKPQVSSKLASSAADLQTYYGLVRSQWKTEGGKFTFDVEIPANTTATIFVPAKPDKKVTESSQALASSKDIKVVNAGDSYTEVKVGSGKYQFVVE